MNRVKHCLTKMHEMIYSNKSLDVIDLDLLLDYTKIIYSELLDAKSVKISNAHVQDSAMALKNNQPLSPQTTAAPHAAHASSSRDNVKVTEDIPEYLEKNVTIEFQSSEKSASHENKTNHTTKNQAHTETAKKQTEINYEAPEPTPPAQDYATKVSTAPVSAAPSNLVDLRRLISLNDKFAYVIELFSGDNESYEQSITKLNGFTTYGNAMEWVIANLQNRYNWNVENDLVLSFYDAISSRFNKKS